MVMQSVPAPGQVALAADVISTNRSDYICQRTQKYIINFLFVKDAYASQWLPFSFIRHSLAAMELEVKIDASSPGLPYLS